MDGFGDLLCWSEEKERLMLVEWTKHPARAQRLQKLENYVPKSDLGQVYKVSGLRRRSLQTFDSPASQRPRAEKTLQDSRQICPQRLLLAGQTLNSSLAGPVLKNSAKSQA